jgi:elongation factor Ts
MAAISAALVKDLREKTGAGMMDCKKALTETEGDIESAVDWLRKKGLAAAAKKASRVAAEGLIGVAVGPRRGAVVELNAETDFVARNDGFQALVRQVTALGLEADGDLDRLRAQRTGDGKTVDEALTHAIATIGENMTLRRYAMLAVEDGVVASYVHNATAPSLGRIGVLVALESTGDKAQLEELGKQVAMHVAAANPQALSVDSVDPALLERERSVLSEQARASGRPENIVEKMVEGRLRKFYEDVVLTEQAWVLDPDKRVGAVLAEAGKAVGAPVVCTGFVRFALGEGVEKQETDFAAEVAATLGG